MASNIKSFKRITAVSTYSSLLCGTTRSLNLPRSDSIKSNKNNNIVIDGHADAGGNKNKWTPDLVGRSPRNLNRMIPSPFWRRRSSFSTSYSFTIKETVAKAIAKAVTSSIRLEGVETTVIEANPGIGLLTKELLDNRLTDIVVYDDVNLAAMTDLAEKYRGRIILKPHNLLLTFKKQELKGCCGFTTDIMKYKDQKFAVVAVNPSRLFVRRVLQMMLWQSNSCDNVVFYLVMCQNIYNCLHSSKGIHSQLYDYGLLHILMETECLQKFPRESFLPPPMYKHEMEDMVLVRLRKLQESPIPSEDLLFFHSFIQILSRSRKSCVIGLLEKWFPGCGPFFIARGLSVTAVTGSLTPQEIVNLFFMVKDLDGYDHTMSFLRLGNKSTDFQFDLDDLEVD